MDPPRPAASIADYDSAVCETTLWRGYVKAQFLAIVRDGEDIYEAGRSPAFRCGRDGPSEDDARAVTAFDRLLDLLADAGWEPVSGGRPWYAYRFRRRGQDVLRVAPAVAPVITRMANEGGEETGS